MKIGIAFANIAGFGTGEGASEFASAAEGAGVEAASLRTAGSVDALSPTAGGQQEKGRKAAAQLVQT